MAYISVADAAKKWNLSERSVRNYCAIGKIPNAVLASKTWQIPEDAKKPKRTNAKTENALLSVIQSVSGLFQNPVWRLNFTKSLMETKGG